MKNLLKADLYRLRKSRITLIALILALGFPVLTVLLFIGVRAITVGTDGDAAVGMLFNANSLIGSVYSLTNNVGLIVPAFAGIIVCTDHSNGTLRNKVIAGNRRASIYLSHLIVSILFAVATITIYAAVTVGLSLLFFPFERDPSQNLALEILYFVVNGTVTFAFIATVSTLFAMLTRNVAQTIIFTIIVTVVLYALTSVLMMINYESFRYAVYFIPTFGSNIFTLSSGGLFGLIGNPADTSRSLIFAESILSYLFFGAVNTGVGLFAFQKRDIR